MIKDMKLKLENHGILYITVHTRNAWSELYNYKTKAQGTLPMTVHST